MKLWEMKECSDQLLCKTNECSDQLVGKMRNEPETDTPVEPNEKGYEREPQNFGKNFV
jgi:hypothetical protein